MELCTQCEMEKCIGSKIKRRPREIGRERERKERAQHRARAQFEVSLGSRKNEDVQTRIFILF